ncbi:hypothetical protein FKM82_026554 [Ascaphus truei]
MEPVQGRTTRIQARRRCATVLLGHRLQPSDICIRTHQRSSHPRWNPVDGYCEKLLPSDRWQWSDVTGLQHQQLDGFELPSPHWEWESDWFVDENIGGEPTEKGGWTYAIDFPATYAKDKKWNSCVRRRRWIRYRRYKSRNSWAKIASHEQNEQLPDPINDISVGGWETTDEPLGRLSVWTVSLQGKGILHTADSIMHCPKGGQSDGASQELLPSVQDQSAKG